MNDLPGHRIDEVFGLTVRSRNIGSTIGAGLKSLGGGDDTSELGTSWTEVCAYGAACKVTKS